MCNADNNLVQFWPCSFGPGENERETGEGVDGGSWQVIFSGTCSN